MKKHISIDSTCPNCGEYSEHQAKVTLTLNSMENQKLDLCVEFECLNCGSKYISEGTLALQTVQIKNDHTDW